MQKYGDTPQDEIIFETLKKWFQEDIPYVRKWRQDAREDYAFYSGDQWYSEDTQLLYEQKRPVMTFNRIAPLVNAILGSERNNKRAVRYIPREIGDAKANEILTAAGEWFREQSEAEYEDSEAFADAVICGMGWVDTRLDFHYNPNGDPVVQRLDPLKMAWDSNAVKANLVDAERLWYVDEKPLHIAKQLFPDIPEHMLHADWAQNEDCTKEEEYRNTSYEIYQEDTQDFDNENPRKRVTLVEARWFENEIYYKIFDPLNAQTYECLPQEYKALLQKSPHLKALRLTRKVVKRAFLGKKLLAPIDAPLVPKGQLGWECITAYQDKVKQQFYGVVRPTKDPQRWTNKFFSQIMYLLNSQAKGGILAERGTFEDDFQAEESLSRADQITWLRHGALGRIQPKPAAQFPSGFFTLFQETKESITQVTGISNEFIGTREINQPGVLETQRRQSSLTLLAQLYESLRRYRKRQGAIVLYLIQYHLSDGRLIRILGKDQQQYIALSRAGIADKDYDIIVDEAPTATNEKEKNFAIIEKMMPYLQPYLTPEIGLEILKYSPLPASLVHKWTQMIEENNKNTPQDVPPNHAEQIEQKKLEKETFLFEIEKQKQELALKKASLEVYQKEKEAQMQAQKASIEKLKMLI